MESLFHCKENKKQGVLESMAGRGVFSWVVRDSLSEEVIFEIRHEGREGTSHGQRRSRSVPSGGSCRFKDPSVRDKGQCGWSTVSSRETGQQSREGPRRKDSDVIPNA